MPAATRTSGRAGTAAGAGGSSARSGAWRSPRWRRPTATTWSSAVGQQGLGLDKRAAHAPRRHIRRHHAQPAEPQRAAGSVRSQRSHRDLRRAGRVQRLGRARTGHVFRTTIGGTAWADISPALDVPFGASRSTAPTRRPRSMSAPISACCDRSTRRDLVRARRHPLPASAGHGTGAFGRGSGILRAATYGRGVFEFVRRTGPTIAVNPENQSRLRHGVRAARTTSRCRSSTSAQAISSSAACSG